MLKINLLAIAGFGILVAIVGIVLYLFRNDLAETIRFLLPIPPLSIAAYVFVLNVFRQYGGKMPENGIDVARELLIGTAVSALIFGLFSFGLMFFLEYSRRYF